MSAKQDRHGVRTAADIERKYNFDKRFSEVLGLANDARESVEHLESELRSEITEQVTAITRDTERIILSALEGYVTEDELGEVESTLKSELEIMAMKIALNFYTTTQHVTEVEGEVQTVVEDLQKHFEFGIDGLVIKAGENSMKLVLDNDLIKFEKNGQQFGWWDGVDFHTGNIVVKVNERAQFGNYAFVPRSNGSLDFLKVGG